MILAKDLERNSLEKEDGARRRGAPAGCVEHFYKLLQPRGLVKSDNKNRFVSILR